MIIATRFFDMFAGIGGFRSGLEQAGGFKCVGFCEIDHHASAAYKAIYNTEKEAYYSDITKIDTAGMPDFDLLVGGLPCQPYSVASANRRGLDDPRGALFFEFARIIGEKRPAAFFVENVPFLLSHNSGKTFEKILGTFSELGYCAEMDNFAPRAKRYITAQPSVCLSQDEGFILSDILMQNVPEKYFLSIAAQKKLQRNSSEGCRGKESMI